MKNRSLGQKRGILTAQLDTTHVSQLVRHPFFDSSCFGFDLLRVLQPKKTL
jgi:hypothetical protein